MAGAGLTRGGFYTYFKTKEEVYAEAILAYSEMREKQASEAVEYGPDQIREFINRYVSRTHLDDIEGQCPLMALPSDAARAGPAARAAYQRLLESMVGVFEANLEAHGVESTFEALSPVVHAEDVVEMTRMASKIHVAKVLKEYLIDVAEATRNDPDLLLGASPRATLFIQRAARTHAAAKGRDYVSPDDVKVMLGPVLNHRLILRPEAQMRGVSISGVIEGITAGAGK